MADTTVDDAAAADEAAEPPKKSRKKLLIIAGPVLLLVLLAAGYFLGLGSLVGLGGSKEVKKAEIHSAFFDVPEMLVNINSGSRRTGYLKISITLEVEDGTTVPQVQAALPRVLDNFQTYLRELRIEDLKGSAGLYRLREELLMRVNAAVAPAKIKDVLFKEMLVQ